LPPENNTLSELMAWTMLKLTITTMRRSFTDFPKKISVVKKNLLKDIMPWDQKGVKGKVVTVG
jgi:hypothetical protein